MVPHDERVRQWIETPKGMEVPPPARQIDRIGAAPIEIGGPEDLEGMVVNVEMLEYPERGG